MIEIMDNLEIQFQLSPTVNHQYNKAKNSESNIQDSLHSEPVQSISTFPPPILVQDGQASQDQTNHHVGLKNEPVDIGLHNHVR